MKKIVSWLLFFCMVFGLVNASAEAVADAAIAQAFSDRINRLLGATGPDKALTFTLAPQGAEPVSAALRMSDAGDLYDLLLQLPGRQTPIELQLGQEALWIAVNGRVYELQFSDLAALAQSLSSASALGEENFDILSRLLEECWQEVVMPGISVMQSPNGTKMIDVSLAVKDLAARLADFIDRALADEEYAQMLLPLLAYAAAQTGYSAAPQDPDGAAAAAGGFAAYDPAELLSSFGPALTAQLRETESDAVFTAHVTLANNASGMNLQAIAAWTENEQTLTLHYTAKDDGGAANMVLSVKVATFEVLHFELNADKEAGSLDCTLALPTAHNEFTLSAVAADGCLQADLLYTNRSRTAAAVSLSALYGDEAVTAALRVSMADGTAAAANLYWSDRRQTLTVHSGGKTLALELTEDEDGSFRASLNTPQDTSLVLEGWGYDGGLTATLTYAMRGVNQFVVDADFYENDEEATLSVTYTPAGQMAAAPATFSARVSRGGSFTVEYTHVRDQFAFRLSGAAGDGCFQASLAVRAQRRTVLTAELLCTRDSYSEAWHLAGTANLNNQTYALNALWSPLVKTASLHAGSNVISVLLRQDEDGRVTLARAARTAARSADSWSIVYDGAKLVWQDNAKRITVTGRFESDSRHVLTISTYPVYGGAESVVTLETVVSGEPGEDWSIVSTLTQNGETLLTASLTAAAKEPFLPLADGETIRIEAASFQQLTASLQQLSKDLTQEPEAVAPTDEPVVIPDAPAMDVPDTPRLGGDDADDLPLQIFGGADVADVPADGDDDEDMVLQIGGYGEEPAGN